MNKSNVIIVILIMATQSLYSSFQELRELHNQLQADWPIDRQKKVMTQELQKVIDEIVDYNIKIPIYSLCSLLHSLHSPRRTEMKDLISRGADVNTRDNICGCTALMLYAKSEDLEMIKELLKKPEIDLDVRDKSGDTVLTLIEKKIGRVKVEVAKYPCLTQSGYAPLWNYLRSMKSEISKCRQRQQKQKSIALTGALVPELRNYPEIIYTVIEYAVEIKRD